MRSAVDAVEQLWGPPIVSPRFGYADIWNADDPPAGVDLAPASTSSEPEIVRPEALWDAESQLPDPVVLPLAPEPSTTSAHSSAELELPEPDPVGPRSRYVLPDTFVAVSPKFRSWRDRLSALGISLALALTLLGFVVALPVR